MKYFFALAAMAGLVSSHSLITHFHVNGKADSSCVRQVADADPVVNLSSNDVSRSCHAFYHHLAHACVDGLRHRRKTSLHKVQGPGRR